MPTPNWTPSGPRCEEQAYALLALQASVARDLRIVPAGTYCAEKVERMGDLAAHIADAARFAIASMLLMPAQTTRTSGGLTGRSPKQEEHIIIRPIKTLAVLAMAGTAILGVTSQASADPNPNNTGSNPQWATLDTQYHVGVDTCPDASCSKADDLTLSPPNDQVLVDCWVSGGTVGTTGDVWYHTTEVRANGSYIDEPNTWTYGPYVDGDQRFWLSPGGLPHC